MVWFAKQSASNSTARISSLDGGSFSAAIACHKLLEGLSGQCLLLALIGPQELGFRRSFHHPSAGIQQISNRLHPNARRQRAESRRLLGDHIGIAAKLDRQI